MIHAQYNKSTPFKCYLNANNLPLNRLQCLENFLAWRREVPKCFFVIKSAKTGNLMVNFEVLEIWDKEDEQIFDDESVIDVDYDDDDQGVDEVDQADGKTKKFKAADDWSEEEKDEEEEKGGKEKKKKESASKSGKKTTPFAIRKKLHM